MAGLTTGGEFSAASIRSYVAEKKAAAAKEQAGQHADIKAEQEKLHAAFLEREVSPEALERLSILVRRAVDAGDKQALVFRFPSDWLPDQGRAITGHESNWHEKLDGFAKRDYDFYERELEPRGFQIRAEILDWPGGMPGDVGFFLQWKPQEEI